MTADRSDNGPSAGSDVGSGPDRAMGLLVFAAVFLLLVSPGLDPDLFWHLETGELIADQGVISSDPFTWTFPGRNWVMHEWLAELALAGLVAVVGFTGLPLVFAGIMAAAWTGLYAVLQGSVVLRGTLVVVAAVAAGPITSVRPATLTYAFLLVTVVLIHLVGTGRAQPRWVLLLVPLMALWVNLHGGFLVGLVYPAVVIVGDVLDRRLGRTRLLTDDARRWLVVALAGAAMAALANPRAVGAYVFAFDSFFNPSFEIIQEWQPTDFRLPQVWPWLALVVIGVFGLIRTRKASVGSLLLFGGALVAALVSYRHVAIHSIVAVPVLAATMPVAEPLRLSRRVVAAGALIVAAIGVWEASVTVRYWQTAEPRFYPVAAVEYMAGEGIATDRLFNTYGWGGWLIRQDIETFVDGRADMFPPEFVLEAVAVQRGSSKWRELFERYGVEAVLLRPTDGLTDVLVDSGEWVVSYRDSIAVVLQPGADSN